MDFTKELVDEVVLAAQDIDYGKITISISGQENAKVVDIITEKRERYRENIPTVPGGFPRFLKDKI